jgi:hypothetical protein
MEISEKESKNIIDYSDITDICIHFIAKKGDVFGPRGLPALGNDNKIIITKNGTKITNRILCESLADYYRLKLLGKYLQEKKMSVKMKGFSK